MAPSEPATLGRAQRPAGFYLALGRTIKVVRTEYGLERKELARLSGLSYPYLSEIEQGKKRLSMESLLAIARALRLPQSELVERAERSLERDRSAADLSVRVRGSTRPAGRKVYGRVYRLDPSVSRSPSRQELQELASRAGQLGADDFHRVLDLARRLAR